MKRLPNGSRSKQTERNTDTTSVIFISIFSVEFRTYFVYFMHSLKKFKSNELPTGPPVVCLNGGGNVGGVGKGGEGCPLILNQRSVETL